ncbi:Vacuolar sorting protein 18 [Camellia lanceoleosa]|nr:Vacuolar sorting protein 18 [Camellia lanceoleosa]
METGRQVFSVDLPERYAKGAWSYHMHGHCNDVIVLGTSKGWIIRHDFGVGDSYDIDLSTGRAGEQSIHRVFVDPGGSHCIATIVGGGGVDTFYTHAKWTRPRVLSKLKGLVVNLRSHSWYDNGQLHEIAIDEKDKKEKHINFLFELKELPKHSWMETSTSNGTKYYMMAITPTALFFYYVDRPVRFMEIPGEIPNSELHFFIKQRRAVHFAWLSGAGIYHGGLNFGAYSPEGNENFVENKGLLDYSKLVDVAEAIKPNSLARSEFHFRYYWIMQGCSLGLFYAYDRNSIFQFVYLDLKEYAAALAEAAFSAKDFLRAASFYAKIYYILSFEEITFKFISVNEQDALRTFLLRKLDNLAKDDKCQITMISTWATELYLDKINRLLLEDDTALENRSSEYHSIIKEFRAFLSDCKDVLDEATTMNLLESYGRVDELVYFASLKEQYEIVVHHYIQQEEEKSIEVLQKLLLLQTSSCLMHMKRVMDDNKNLNPRKLIPAMMRYSIIKYLEFCVHRLQNEDPGVHNLLLSLYAKQEDDSALLRFLQCKFGKGRLSGPEFFYDPKYALRLCLKEKRMRACVHIYSMMSMHEEAVGLALQKLWLMVAKHVVEQEKGTKRENIRKAIAFLKETDGLLKIEDILPFFPDFALIDDFKVAICSSLEDYNKQIEQLKQEMNDATQGADNIRNDIIDLLHLFITCEFQVCQRKILTASWDHRMARGYPSVGAMAPFYVFPCGHAFHAHCLIAHVTRCTHRDQAEYILDLQKQLTLLGGESKKDSNGTLTEEESITSMTPTDKIRSQLDDAIACECPFYGDLMIREISLPFILPGEAHEAASWEIRPHNIGAQKSLSLAAEYILDLQKQLSLLGGESKKESNGTLTEEESITSMTPTDKIRSQLEDAIACECPFCGDLMIQEISLPFILPGEAYEAASWEIRPQNIGAQKSLSLAV